MHATRSSQPLEGLVGERRRELIFLTHSLTLHRVSFAAVSTPLSAQRSPLLAQAGTPGAGREPTLSRGQARPGGLHHGGRKGAQKEGGKSAKLLWGVASPGGLVVGGSQPWVCDSTPPTTLDMLAELWVREDFLRKSQQRCPLLTYFSSCLHPQDLDTGQLWLPYIRVRATDVSNMTSLQLGVSFWAIQGRVVVGFTLKTENF